MCSGVLCDLSLDDYELSVKNLYETVFFLKFISGDVRKI